jgi:hypothetical protein
MLNRNLLATSVPGWSILIRLLVGLIVFFPEGIQKLIFPDILGAGRFVNIGIPYPELMGPFVGVVETICGALIILGLFTRLAAIPLIIRSFSAMISGFSTCRSCRATVSGAWRMRPAPISTCCSAVFTCLSKVPACGRWTPCLPGAEARHERAAGPFRCLPRGHNHRIPHV